MPSRHIWVIIQNVLFQRSTPGDDSYTELSSIKENIIPEMKDFYNNKQV